MFLKNLFDKTVSFLLLLLLLPVFLGVGLIIKLSSNGPIFFPHERIGLGGKKFMLLKFRSMYVGADKLGYQTDVNDSRVTGIGRYLRKYSIDELPQIINVLKGDMSLVGPRPDTPMQEKDYTCEQWVQRHKVKPGITGLAQVNGRSLISAEDRLMFDLNYVKEHNMILDFKILFRTFMLVLGKGAN